MRRDGVKPEDVALAVDRDSLETCVPQSVRKLIWVNQLQDVAPVGDREQRPPPTVATGEDSTGPAAPAGRMVR